MCFNITWNPKILDLFDFMDAFSQSQLTLGITAFAILAMSKKHQYDCFYTCNLYVKFYNSNIRYFEDTRESLSLEIQLF